MYRILLKLFCRINVLINPLRLKCHYSGIVIKFITKIITCTCLVLSPGIKTIQFYMKLLHSIFTYTHAYIHTPTHAHAHTHMYVYIYIFVCRTENRGYLGAHMSLRKTSVKLWFKMCNQMC